VNSIIDVPRALTRSRIPSGGLAELERRVLDGEPRAMRALVRQASGVNTLDLPFRDVELKAKPNGTGGTRLLFTGYASVTEEGYMMWDWLGDYTEVMNAGAFTKTLGENPDAIFCLNHDWQSAPMARTIAGTMRMTEDSTGLANESDLDGARDDVYRVQSCMDAGELNAMSLAFYVTRQTWSPDYMQRNIVEVDLDGGDNSVVTFPANPLTTGTTALRTRAANAIARSRVPALIAERARVEKRAGATLSTATMSTLQEVLDLIADADIAVDAAQEVLSELMGVENPNADDESTSSDDTSSETNSADVDAESKSIPTGPDPVAVRERLRLQHELQTQRSR